MVSDTSFITSVLMLYTHSLKHQKNYHSIDLSLFTHLTQETENNSFIQLFKLLFCSFSKTKSMKWSKMQYFGVLKALLYWLSGFSEIKKYQYEIGLKFK